MKSGRFICDRCEEPTLVVYEVEGIWIRDKPEDLGGGLKSDTERRPFSVCSKCGDEMTADMNRRYMAMMRKEL